MVQKKSAARPRNVQPPAGFDRPPAAVYLKLQVGEQFMGEIISMRDVEQEEKGKMVMKRVMEVEESGTGRVLSFWPKSGVVGDLDRLKAREGDWIWIYRAEDVPSKRVGYHDRHVYEVAIRRPDTAGTEEAPY